MVTDESFKCTVDYGQILHLIVLKIIFAAVTNTEFGENKVMSRSRINISNFIL